MEDVLEIVIKGDKMARDQLKKILEQRDKQEHEFDEQLKKQRIERISSAEENLKVLISNEKSKYEKMSSEVENIAAQKAEIIKKFFADNEKKWIQFIVSETVNSSDE